MQGIAKPAWLVVAAFTASSCSQQASPPSAPTTTASSSAPPRLVRPVPSARVEAPLELYTPPSGHDFTDNPKLLQRVTGTAHGYFRFINSRFCKAVCRRFRNEVRTMPTLNLHGDAHIEQYAVTHLGRGLTDFDDSTSGPGIVDLARFGVSIYLTCAQKGWESERQPILERFLAGYREGLSNPDVDAPEPPIATRIRNGFTPDRPQFFAWTESLMKPLVIEQTEFDQMIALYAKRMREQNAELPPHFFEVKKAGSIHIGVGSALDEKYLMRVEGPTRSPDDDVILEAKEVRPPSGASCVHKTDIDPFRILLGQSRIAYRPYLYLGYTRRGDRMLWVHEWMEQYEELTIAETITSAADLSDVAHDVGIQLGRGHPNQIAAPLEPQVRGRQLSVIEELEPRLLEVIEELTVSATESWQRFRAEATP